MIAPATIRLPKLYPKQRNALFHDRRYGLVEASTKSGKTVGCIAWLIAEAVRTGRDGRNYWWVAPIFPQAKIAFRRMRRILRRADPQQQYWSENKTELTLTLANGATIWFKGADDPDSLYGEDVFAAVIDEATRCKEDAWIAVRSTLTATRGPIRIIGNVKGRGNWAYRMARKAESGAADMAYAKITAYDAVEAGVLAAEEIQDAQAQLPEKVFKELYLAIPDDDGGNPFGLTRIAACAVDGLASGPVAYWGIDLASRQDWTVVIGLNASGQVCAFHRWQDTWENIKLDLFELVKRGMGLIDETGTGQGVAEEVSRKNPNIKGFTFTQPSKQKLMGSLAYAIHNRTVGYPKELGNQTHPILSELNSFEYEVKVVNGRVTNVLYSAPAGLHDDCVCALALAVYCMMSVPQFGVRVISTSGKPAKKPPVERVNGKKIVDDSHNERVWRTVEV